MDDGGGGGLGHRSGGRGDGRLLARQLRHRRRSSLPSQPRWTPSRPGWPPPSWPVHWSSLTWAAKAALLALTASLVLHDRPEHQEPEQSQQGDQPGHQVGPLGQDRFLGKRAVEDYRLLVFRSDGDLVRFLLGRSLPEPLSGLDPDPDEPGLARGGVELRRLDVEFQGLCRVQRGDLIDREGALPPLSTASFWRPITRPVVARGTSSAPTSLKDPTVMLPSSVTDSSGSLEGSALT